MRKSILRKAALLAAPVALVAGLTGATLGQTSKLSPKRCYKLELVQVWIHYLEWVTEPIYEGDLENWDLLLKGCSAPTWLETCEVPVWVEVKCP